MSHFSQAKREIPDYPFAYRAACRSAVVVAGAAVFPILLAGLSQAYVFYALPQLHWVSLSWRDRGVPVFLSFAFWEWITCVVLSAYMAILPLATLVGFRSRNTRARQFEI
jgi:hypothetical protein